MASVVECVEPDEVRVEEGTKNLLADREGAVDLGGRKRRMEEKSEL